MKREDILNRLEEIASTPGFIYTLALLLLQDIFLDPSESADINWGERISFQEFSLLVGLMVKHEVKLEFPTEENHNADTIEIFNLLHDLHRTHFGVFFQKLKENFDEEKVSQLTEEQKEEAFRNLFGSGEMMTEPIFYGGSGAYDFQYNDLAIKKYRYDSAWIKKEKGFSIEEAAQIAKDLKSMSAEKAAKIKIAQSFENLCAQIFDIFCFSSTDICSTSDAEVQSFLTAFSLRPGTVNKSFNSIGQYNALASHPILKLDTDLYFLPLCFTLAESVYESPFYWMLNTKYAASASNNRGKATEDIAYEILLPVFGTGLFRNIRVQNQKAQDVTDIDILAIGGNKAVVFQAKSKRLTELSRLGNTEKLKKDFSEAVQSAYNQALSCRDAILNKSNHLVNERGEKIRLDERINDVYIVCLTSDHYPAVISQVETYLIKKKDDPYPVCMSVFDLDIVSFYLNDAFEFLYYVRQRICYSAFFKCSSEMAFLGFHLNQKLFKSSEEDMIAIDEGFAQLIDANFPVLKGHHPETPAVERLHTEWKNEKFRKLIAEVKSTNEPGFTDAVFFLYDLAGDGADELINAMEKSIHHTKSDGRNHDFSLIYGKGESGVTFVSQTGSPETLSPALMRLAIARKYKTKASTWLALGSIVESDRMIDCLGFVNQPWEFDKDLDDFSKVYLKRGTAIGRNGKKVGRNDNCPCGKIKPDGMPMKFKKCCGK